MSANLQARTIAIASGKGGVGKSFLALNLAWCLAELGQRVLLIELDKDAGALSIAAGLGAPSALPPAKDATTLAQRVLTVPGNARVQLLRASDLPTQAMRSPARLAPLLAELQVQWHIADLAPGLGEQTILWLSRASRAVLIATPELVTVQAVLRLQQQLQWQHAFERLRSMDERLQTGVASLSAMKREVDAIFGDRSEALWAQAWKSFVTPTWVFNRLLPDDQAQFARIAAYLKTHGGDCAANAWKIPEDSAQTRCARFGRVLARHESTSDAASAIRTIAAELVNQVATESSALTYARESAA
jgi:MinD-like ATPase involved in chromosome partitioning or flagellar assembly